MLFKALTTYRTPTALKLTADLLQEKLSALPFVPCGPLQVESRGWVSPYEDDRYVVSQAGQLLIALVIEKKKVPAAMVKQHLALRIEEIENQEGRTVGRKEKKDLKAAVIDALLPTIPPKQAYLKIWIDTVTGRISVGTASAGAAEAALKLLDIALGEFPAVPLTTIKTLASLMKDWLASGEASGDFSLGAECEMRLGESGATVRYAKHNLNTEDIKHHVLSGKEVVSLGATFDDSVALTLSGSMTALSLKKLKLVGLDNEAEVLGDRAAQLEADFILETGAYAKLIGHLIEELGGLNVDAE